MNQEPFEHADDDAPGDPVPPDQQNAEGWRLPASSLPPNPYESIPQPGSLADLAPAGSLGFEAAFWLVLGICAVAVIGVSLFALPLGILAGFVLALSFFRVFMVRLTLRRRRLLKNAVGPIGSLMASAPIVVGIFVASCLAFMAICFPLALVASGANGSTSIETLMSVSGLVAVAVFFLLYVLSFRLTI